MKTKNRLGSNSARRKKNAGFTLIEILIVLGIIAAIIALGIPAYGYAILRSHVTSATGTAYQLTTAITNLEQQTGGSGTIPLTENVGTATIADFSGTGNTAVLCGKAATLDNLLLTSGLLSKPIACKMGSQQNTPTGTVPVIWTPASQTFASTAAPDFDYTACTRVECAMVDPTATPGSTAGNGMNFLLDGTTSLPAGARVAYMVIKGVTESEANALAIEVDTAANAAAVGAAQTKGQVAFAAASGGVTDVYYYLGSQ